MGSYDSSWVSFSKSYYEWSVSSKKIDTWTEWYENGNRKFVEQYKDRNLTHSLKFYENGMKERETNYDKEGKVISKTKWNKDGSKIK